MRISTKVLIVVGVVTLASVLTGVEGLAKISTLQDTNTAQSGDCVRVSGVSIQHTPATKIWFGQVSNTPGYRSLPHHHGEAETGGYVLSGHGRIYFGEDYQDYIDMTAGDWVFVPPFMPHVEANMSVTEDLVWLTARTPENLVVNLEDVPDESLADYRRV